MTINKERYLVVLNTFYKDLKSLYPGYLPKIWFQQDRATPHNANISKEWLTEHFGRRIISSKFPIEWAPHSPDLSPPNFFLWGYLKDRVYQEKPRNLTDLKNKISEEIN